MPVLLNLKDGYGRTIASEEFDNIFKIGDESHYAVVTGVKYKKRYTGYVAKTTLDSLNVSTVSIPANFAGLEAVSTPTRIKEQFFEITEVVENEDYVEVTAEHIFYRQRQNQTLWKPTEDTQYTGAAALRNILTNTITESHYKAASDCTDTKPGSELDFERKNVVEALLDPNSGLCAKYGLSLIRDNDLFYCLKEVGYDRGMVIQNEKNLLGVERKESIEKVVTRVAPIGKTAKGDIVWLDNGGKKYIDSDNIGDYAEPRTEIYDTGLQIGKEGVTESNIQAKLLEAGQKRFSEDKVDIPEVTMTIEFLSLGDTEEYAQYRDLDKVYLYDILTIKDTVRGYNYSAQVIGVEHDILTGMLLSVTIGSVTNADDTRKIATWQVPEIDGANIRLKTIMAGSFEDGAINSDDLANGAVHWLHINTASIDELTANQLKALTANIHELIAGTITADDIVAGSITADLLHAGAVTAEKIDTEDITAINAVLGTATITDGMIDNANISYARIMDASVENLIAQDAITDRYFIHKLAVENAQIVEATVGDLIIKAADSRYYKLVIQPDGSLEPVEVTTLTNGEINAGVTSDGRSSIIETDLLVSDLSATNMKAINALIDKITASRIDVDELFARRATIPYLNAKSIIGDRMLALAVNNASTLYTQYSDPAAAAGNTVKDGDRWKKTVSQGSTWQALWTYTINDLKDYTLEFFGNSELYARLDGQWVFWTDDAAVESSTASLILTADTIRASVSGAVTQADLELKENEILLEVSNNYYHTKTSIDITEDGIELSGSKYLKLMASGQTTMLLDSTGFDMQTAGKAFIHAKDDTTSAIIFGSDVSNASFYVDLYGSLFAKKITTNDLIINGSSAPGMVVADSQPSGHNLIWFKPNGITEESFTISSGDSPVASESQYCSLQYYHEFTINYTPAEALAGTGLFYGCTARLYVFSLSSPTYITLKARLKKGDTNTFVEIGSVKPLLYTGGGYVDLNVMMTTSDTNLMSSSGGSFKLWIETDYDKNKCRMSGNITLKVKSLSTSGAASCNVYYIE